MSEEYYGLLRARVTQQRPTWHDGQPVKDWPRREYLGTVVSVDPTGFGYARAKVEFDSGRIEWVRADRLFRIDGRMPDGSYNMRENPK